MTCCCHLYPPFMSFVKKPSRFLSKGVAILFIMDVFVVRPSDGPKSIIHTGKLYTCDLYMYQNVCLQAEASQMVPWLLCSRICMHVVVRSQLRSFSSFRYRKGWFITEISYPVAVYRIPANFKRVSSSVEILLWKMSILSLGTSVQSHKCPLRSLPRWQTQISALPLVSIKASFLKVISMPNRLKWQFGSGNGLGDSELQFTFQQQNFKLNNTH